MSNDYTEKAVAAIENIYREAAGDDATSVERKIRFLREFTIEYSYVGAADKAGISVNLLRRYCDDKDHLYDEAFAGAIEEVRVRHAFEAEDKAMIGALKDDNKTLLKMLLPTLPVIGDKFAPQGKAEKGDTNVFLFTKEGVHDTVSFLHDLKGRMKEIPS